MTPLAGVGWVDWGRAAAMARLAAVLLMAVVVGVGAAGVAQSATEPSQGRPFDKLRAEPGAPNPARDDKGVTNGAPADDAEGHGFEVATVKPANRDDGRRFWGYEATPSGRFVVSAETLNDLALYAYVGMQITGLVEGGPKWAKTDEWDIEAKLDEADLVGWDKLGDRERLERVRPRLRALLVERFGLKVHTEMKMTPVYALVQAKGGVKMKEVEAPPANMDPQEWEEWMRSGKIPDGPTPGSLMSSGNGLVGHAVEVSALVGQIGDDIGATDKMMVDETGLDGHYYDFSIKLTKEKDGPTMEQQIEDGLGLRVEERKVPMKTYVIDGAERPGEN
jgi:uncharacterized protein (TIGR03435 family)